MSGSCEHLFTLVHSVHEPGLRHSLWNWYQKYWLHKVTIELQCSRILMVPISLLMPYITQLNVCPQHSAVFFLTWLTPTACTNQFKFKSFSHIQIIRNNISPPAKMFSCLQNARELLYLHALFSMKKCVEAFRYTSLTASVCVCYKIFLFLFSGWEIGGHDCFDFLSTGIYEKVCSLRLV